MPILVGAACWTDKSLIGCGRFYPKEASSAEARLCHYAMPSATNAQLWAERTPASFVFNIKAFRLFTGRQTLPTVLPKDTYGSVAGTDARRLIQIRVQAP